MDLNTRMRGWFRRKAEPPPARRPAWVPEDLRLYAIGDVHGRADLLARLHEMIRADAAAAPQTQRRIVYLGDYIDRGPETREVIELLLEPPLDGFERVFLKGNHEDAMLRFLDEPAIAPLWFGCGGVATLLSYGVAVPASEAGEELQETQAALEEALPAAHLAFLERLALTHAAGDYFFVHAGVRPGVALAEQQEQDLMWIREPFLRANDDFGKIVVHGHSIAFTPELRPNRIGIDTGAFATGRLTALVLAGDSQALLQT
jgi:serine/threonine protein phosphatase 1